MNRRQFFQSLLGLSASTVVAVKVASGPSFWQKIGDWFSQFCRPKYYCPLPTFDIVSCPVVPLSEYKARRFRIIDRANIQAKEAFQQREDAAIFNEINRMV